MTCPECEHDEVIESEVESDLCECLICGLEFALKPALPDNDNGWVTAAPTVWVGS
jgi:hypothetical protein